MRRMLLAIDVGNTQTVVGLYPADEDGSTRAELLDHWRIATNAERTSDEYALVVQEFLAFHGFSFSEHVTGLAVSSVVPRVTAAVREMCLRYFGFLPLAVEPGVRTGMPILYDNPKEVGADRIANAVAAFDLYGGPTVVVDFGTGTNFDVVSAKGEFLGGVIAPGLQISAATLVQRAARLTRVELDAPASVIGTSTVAAIQSGLVFGTAGEVDGIVERIRAELGSATTIATGGLAPVVIPHCRTIDHHEPFLTLEGLRLVHEKNVDD